MARPIKKTVDYFPHQVGNGKTKLILQNEFGNDGYAFWFQLIELLCVSNNQVYDYNDPASWRLLLAETHVTSDLAIKILQLLADLNAIDPEQHKNKIIWCQNLIDNLELVYKRRATGTPEKPVNVNNNPVNVNKSTQTKQYNTKLNKTKPDNTKDIPVKKEYGEFNNVLLTDDEYSKLLTRFTSGLKGLIETLSAGIESKGYKYKSHYAAILNWAKREPQHRQSGPVRAAPQADMDAMADTRAADDEILTRAMERINKIMKKRTLTQTDVDFLMTLPAVNGQTMYRVAQVLRGEQRVNASNTRRLAKQMGYLGMELPDMDTEEVA